MPTLTPQPLPFTQQLIVTPHKQFTDRFNAPNAFLAMNPSLHIDEEGNFILLVRRVNYRKFADRRFTLQEGKSHSAQLIARGRLQPNETLDTRSLTFQDLAVEYNLPKVITQWTGVEDIRFLSAKEVLVTVPELNPNRGNPCIFKATLEGNTLRDFTICNPHEQEKNWMPFTSVLDSTQKVIQKVSPLSIKSVLTDVLTIIPGTPNAANLSGWHGSTNGLQTPHGHLFLIHHSQAKTKHRWFLYEETTGHCTVSEPFEFFTHSQIEFPCSLAVWGDQLLIPMGLNDDTALILEMSLSAVLNSLTNSSSLTS